MAVADVAFFQPIANTDQKIQLPIGPVTRGTTDHISSHSFIRGSIVAWVRSNCSGVTVMCRRQGRTSLSGCGDRQQKSGPLQKYAAARIDAAIVRLLIGGDVLRHRADALDRPLFQAGNVDVEQRAGRVALPRDLLDDLARVPRPAGS